MTRTPTTLQRPDWRGPQLHLAREYLGRLEDEDRRATDLGGYGGARLDEAREAEIEAEEAWGEFLVTETWAAFERWLLAGMPDVDGEDDESMAYLRAAGEAVAHMVELDAEAA